VRQRQKKCRQLLLQEALAAGASQSSCANVNAPSPNGKPLDSLFQKSALSNPWGTPIERKVLSCRRHLGFCTSKKVLL
jgi:hypothetical protein